MYFTSLWFTPFHLSMVWRYSTCVCYSWIYSIVLFISDLLSLFFIAGCSFLTVSYVLHIIVFLRASSSITEVPNYYQYMFTGNTTNHTVNLFIHYSHQVKARLFLSNDSGIPATTNRNS